MIGSLFKVATEFRFEIGSALVNTKALTGAVENLSTAADNVLASFQTLGAGFALNLGTGGAGLLGLLQKSISASEKFADYQIKLSGIFAANKDKFTSPVNEFNNRLAVSQDMLLRISEIARKFSLPETELAGVTSQVLPVLATEGLAGVNGGNAIEMSRQFAKAAPGLGIDIGQSMQQMIDTLMGQASGQGRFFQRLTTETDAMKEFVGNTKKFNMLKPEERMLRITAALDQFSRSLPELEARTKTFSSATLRLNQVLTGFNGILVPLGQEITKVLIMIMDGVGDVLNIQGRLIVNEFVKIFRGRDVASNLKAVVATILQLKDASADLKRTGSTVGVAGSVLAFGFILSKFTRLAWLASPALGAISAGFMILYYAFQRMEIPLRSIAGVFLTLAVLLAPLGYMLFLFARSLLYMAPVLGVIEGAKIAFFVSHLGKLGFVFKILGFALSRLLLPLAIIMTVFQIISRAVAIAKIKDILALPEITGKIVALMGRLRVAIGMMIFPFVRLFDAMANAIAFLFQRTTLVEMVLPALDGFVTLMESLGRVILDATAATMGYYRVIEAFFKASWMRPGGSSFMESMRTAWDRGLQEVYGAQGEGVFGNTPSSQQIININGGVHISNEFKEQMEPDRVAFSIKEQLLKSAMNRTQSKGRAMARPAAAVGMAGG